MSIDQNWQRWILASTSKHFGDNVGSIDFFVEGQRRQEETDQDLFEFRLIGPDYSEVSKNEYRVDLSINIAIQVVMDSDFHRMSRRIGLICSLFNVINVYKYGDGVGDDDSFLMCLKPLQDRRDKLMVLNFGQIDQTKTLLQAMVEGKYYGDLTAS
jgi:hypothetical protein